MKKVLVTAQNSYLGNVLSDALAQEYLFHKVSLRDPDWQKASWKGYDVVLHVAGIAHVSYRSVESQAYFEVNRDMTFKVAQKAKEEGLSQCLFFSTMLVYGESTAKPRPITASIPVNPSTAYAQSKLEAEEALKTLEDDDFRVVILRLPMIYGPHSKGNYQKLAALSLKVPFFPVVNNKRSMLFSGDLVLLIDGLITQGFSGTVYPQNDAPVRTSDLVKTIRAVHGKKTLLIPGFNGLIRWLLPLSPALRKLFGSFYYDDRLSRLPFKQEKTPFVQSIALSEGVEKV